MFAAFSISIEGQHFLKKVLVGIFKPGHRLFLKHFAPGNEGYVICLFCEILLILGGR